MAERTNEIPDPWRESLISLGLTAAAISRATGVNSDTVEDILSGKAIRARRSTLVRISQNAPVDNLDKLELLRRLGIGGIQRNFSDILVAWEGTFASFGQHADEILRRVGLRTREEHQMVANIGLRRIESIAIGVRTFGPQLAADLPL